MAPNTHSSKEAETLASGSKDGEVRARVTAEVFNELEKIAKARSEKLPVIVREALMEYLARRLQPGAPAEQRQAILGALHEYPGVVQALLAFADAIRRGEPAGTGAATHHPASPPAGAEKDAPKSEVVEILKRRKR